MPLRARRAFRWLERLLLLVALACLGTYAYAYFDARYTDLRENRKLDEALAQSRAQQAAQTGTRPASETDSFQSFAAQPEPAPQLTEGELVGRLEIPRLGVSAIVLEGVESRTLRRGLGHIPGTEFPSQGGNVGIAGHRDSFFRPLKDIGKNDIIELTTPRGTFRYAVDWTRIVKPEDTEVLTPEAGQPSLTLVTCYPFYYVGSAPKRFIVRAHRV